ncbi:MAG: DMT family transporter [Alphaproteobacteria bacterium]
MSSAETTAAPQPNNALKAIAWMALSGLGFSAMTGVLRYVTETMDPLQAGFLRYAFSIFLLAPYFIGGRFGQLRTQRLHWHVIRGALHTTGVLLWFFALTRIPLADITALSFTSPLFATVGAVLFLGERLHARRIGAVLMGFAGTLVVIRPGFSAIDLGVICMLISSPLFAISELIAKNLSRHEGTATIVTYQTVTVTAFALVPALWVWETPSWADMGLLCLTALVATGAHLCWIRALKEADVTVTQPIKFLTLVWAAAIGFFAYGEVPDIWVWVGGAIIFASASYIAHREAQIRRQGKETVAPVATSGPANT